MTNKCFTCPAAMFCFAGSGEANKCIFCNKIFGVSMGYFTYPLVEDLSHNLPRVEVLRYGKRLIRSFRLLFSNWVYWRIMRLSYIPIKEIPTHLSPEAGPLCKLMHRTPYDSVCTTCSAKIDKAFSTYLCGEVHVNIFTKKEKKETNDNVTVSVSFNY